MKKLVRIIFIALLIMGSAFSVYSQNTGQGTGSISGRVTVNGRPGRGVAVIMVYEGKDKNDDPRSFAELLGRINRFTCGEDGSFHITNLDAGRYQIATYAPSMVGIAKTTDTKSDNDKQLDSEDSEETHKQRTESPSNGRNVILQDGEKVENVDFNLARGGVITGRVTYEDGSPAIGVVMQLQSMQANSKNYYTPNMEFESSPMKTDDRGIYRIYGLPDGRYKISAVGKTGEAMQVLSADRYRRRTYHPNVTDEASAGIIEIVNGNEVGNIDIKFADPSKGYMVSGRVIAADTNRLIPNVQVVLTPQNSETPIPPEKTYTTANSRGEFKLTGIPSGSYNILSPRGAPDADNPMSNSDYYSYITKFEVKDGDVRGVTVRLQSGISIAGSIVIEGGDSGLLAQTPGLGLYAGVQPSGPEAETNLIPSSSFADVNQDGSFLLRGLSPGRANFSLHNKGDNGISLQILRVEGSNVTDGRTAYLQKGDNLTNIRIIVAAANCTVKGQVKLAGTLPKNTEIQIYAHKVNAAKKSSDKDNDDIVGQASADANGNFTISGLIAGQYEIVAEVITGMSKEGEPITREAKQFVTLTSGQEATVTLIVEVK